MESIYKKDELTFSLIWIGIYVVACSIARSLSASIGISNVVVAPVCLVLTAVIYLVMKKLGILEKCGICLWKGSAGTWLWFIPVLVVVTANFWHGVTMNGTVLEMALHIIAMFCVGFLEEVIFRGFLFNALRKSNKLLTAIIISGLTFGIGHIVNLLNGAPLLGTLRQLVYACSIGVMLTMVFYVSKSLWPCIVFHGVFNALCFFAVSGSELYEWLVFTGIISVVCLAYSFYLWRKRPQEA